MCVVAATAPGKQSETGFYNCGLCMVTNMIGKSHDGTLRHCCGRDHVHKWLAAHPGETRSSVELREACGSVWGSKRVELTTVAKVAKQAKAMKGERARLVEAMRATVTEHVGSPAQPAVPPLTPQTVTVPRATPATAAEIGAAIAAQVTANAAAIDTAAAAAVAGQL